VENSQANLSLGMRQLNGIYLKPSIVAIGGWDIVSGPIQAFGGEGIVPVGALPLHCAHPMRVKGNVQTGTWKWSSYRATRMFRPRSAWRLTGCLGQLERIWHRRRNAIGICPRGIGQPPWEQLKGQIYLGSEAFIERHSPRNRELKEIPRAQVERSGLSWRDLKGSDDRGILQAYKEHGYRLHEIAAHLGCIMRR